MIVSWVFHRFVRAERRWIDTVESDAAKCPGILAPAEPELEATLDIDGKVVIRDVLWPLALRFCFEPFCALAIQGQREWTYRCFDAPTTFSMRADRETVWIRRKQEEEIAFAAEACWPALVEAGSRVAAMAERDRGKGNRNVELLISTRDRVEAMRREHP